MKKMCKDATRSVNGGFDRCRICGQYVGGSYWNQYKHCLKHASRCLPWSSIMGLAFGIFL